MTIDPLFKHYALNDVGQAKAARIGEAFTKLLFELEGISPLGSREGALVRTKLEEAGYFAKKAMATLGVNQVPQ